MNVMTAASELPFFVAVHESARRAVHEVKGQCTRLSGLYVESVNGRTLRGPEGSRRKLVRLLKHKFVSTYFFTGFR